MREPPRRPGSGVNTDIADGEFCLLVINDLRLSKKMRYEVLGDRCGSRTSLQYLHTPCLVKEWPHPCPRFVGGTFEAGPREAQ